MRPVQAQPGASALPSHSGQAGPSMFSSGNPTASLPGTVGTTATMQGAQPPPVPEARPGETSVNIAIEDMKDFQESVAPVRELYSEFTTADGSLLFECQGLTKDTGIDLMDCPLNISLKLRVRRRMPQGAHVLWHVVLPMPLISKHLLSPPHEWQTWLGLLPNTMNLDIHPPDVIFTQSVHLISRPEFPKLRLKFKYHNPELQAQLQAKREREEQELKHREDIHKNVGKKAFEDLQHLFKGSAAPSTPGSSPPASGLHATAGYNVEQVAPTIAVAAAEAPWPQPQPQQPPRDRLVVSCSLQFANAIRDLLVKSPLRPDKASLRDLPPVPTVEQVFANSTRMLDEVHMPLLQSIEAIFSSIPAPAPAKTRLASEGDVEPQLIEGLRMALMGMMEDAEGAKMPRTSTNLSVASAEQMMSTQGQFPGLWEAYREVSALAKERARLCQDQMQLSESNKRLQEEILSLRSGMEKGTQDEVHTLRRQCAVAQQTLRDKDAEVARLRAELDEYRKQHNLEHRQMPKNSHNL